MTQCLVSRLLLLPVVCLFLGLCGCAGAEKIAKDQVGLENKSAIKVDRQQKKGAENTAQGLLFPSEVEGLHLISLSAGEEASTLMDGFLGADCDIEEAYIAGYRGRGVEMVFWIVEMRGEAEARELLEQMRDRTKISPSFTGYKCLAERGVGSVCYARVKDGHAVFAHNYFYCKGTRVYWVNASGDNPLTVLREFMSRI